MKNEESLSHFLSNLRVEQLRDAASLVLLEISSQIRWGNRGKLLDTHRVTCNMNGTWGPGTVPSTATTDVPNTRPVLRPCTFQRTSSVWSAPCRLIVSRAPPRKSHVRWAWMLCPFTWSWTTSHTVMEALSTLTAFDPATGVANYQC